MQPTESNSQNRKQYLQEAKTHLEKIERGLLNVSGVVKQRETLESLHQSAQVLTRGAAKNNLETIQQTAQFFEDCFGMMRTASVVSDKKLEDILWRIFEMFKGLLEMYALNEPVEYTKPIEQAVWQELRPKLAEAERHLKSRILHEEATMSELVSDNDFFFDEQVNAELEAMEIILNGENPSHYRNDIKEHCQTLEQIGGQRQLTKWVELLKTAKSAIAATENSVKVAAECAIADIREAQKLIARGQPNTIKPSQPLKAMSRQLSSLSSPWDTQTNSDEDEIKIEIPRQKEINQQETIADQPEISRFGKQRVSSASDDTLDLNLDPWTEQQKLKSQGKSNYRQRPDETIIELLEDETANEAEDNSQWLWDEDDLAPKDDDDSLDDLFGDDETQNLDDALEALLDDPKETEHQGTFSANNELDLFLEEEQSEVIQEGISQPEEPREDLGGVFETSPGTFLQAEAYNPEYEAAASEISAFSFSHEIQYYQAIEQLEELIKAPPQTQLAPQAIDSATLEAYIEESPLTPSESLIRTNNDNDLASTPKAAVGRSLGYEQTVKVSVRLMDNLNNLIGELVVNRNSLEQDQERLRQFLDNLLEQVQNLNELGVRMQDLYERSLLEAALMNSQSHYGNRSLTTRGNDSGFGSYPSNNGEQYNPLEMDRFSGFHTLSQEMIELIVRVRESSSDIEFLVDKVEQEARVFRQVTTQLQEGFTSARMVPFSQVSNRLPRAVRSISIKLNKKAKLQIEGETTLVDKMILEQLYDPMTHLVNNAITHGIELPEERKKAGKPETGLIKVAATLKGNQTIISISDDGAGLDAARIRKKAIEKGITSEAEAKNLSDLDAFDFIFHPGFSTKDVADGWSGRGVGMDVVRSALNKLRGTINIDSTLGKGTIFTIVLPLTLSITTALRCKLNQSDIAFPVDGVEEQIQTTKDQIFINEKGERFIRSQKTAAEIPFKHLSELLYYNRTMTRSNVFAAREEAEEMSVVVLQSTGSVIAVQVDQVLVGQQEVVIKQLTGPVPRPVGIAGVTVTSDGSVMAIADVLQLIDLFYGRVRKDVIPPPVEQELSEVDAEPMVLIVDDSITVRELLSMSFVKAGYRVEQARDGKEAWEKLRAGLACDMMFCDIEMPKMDGLELLSRVKEEERFADLPVGMLTSRGAERHRQMAARLGAKGYFTKPYLEEILLDAAKRMLQGENMMERKITSGVNHQ